VVVELKLASADLLLIYYSIEWGYKKRTTSKFQHFSSMWHNGWGSQ